MPYLSRASPKMDMMYKLERHQEDMLIQRLDENLTDTWTGLDHH